MSQTVQLNEKEAKLKEYEERVQNLQENLETRISSIAELNEKLKAQEEMYSESLNSALHSNVRDIDDHGRGNSLFSEVESRRVKGISSSVPQAFSYAIIVFSLLKSRQ